MNTVRIEDGVPWIGSRSYPWASLVRSEDHDTAGYEFHRRHIHLTFENGWTLSITWGTGTYSSNHMIDLRGGQFLESVEEVEVAAWPDGGEMIPWDDGDVVKSYVTVKELEVLIAAIPLWPSELEDASEVDSGRTDN